MRRPLTTSRFVLCLLAWCAGISHAAVKPHGLFSDGAVLQQGIAVPVWGTADDGEKVTVRFQDQEVSTVAQGGRWLVKLQPLKAGGPFPLFINAVEVKDVLVGEVWVCSGQSNMRFPLKQATTGAAALTNCVDRQLRLLSVSLTNTTGWSECAPASAADFSAVGYFFGRDLRRALQTPVGLIHASLGNTSVQMWMSWPGIEANPAFRDLTDANQRNEANYRAALAKYEQQPGTNAPPKRTERVFGKLYASLIAPLQPYGIRGVLWFQGEANSTAAAGYPRMFLELIRGWRADWGQGDFPFLFAQLGPFVTPEIREAQLNCWQRSTNTAMVVATDCLEGAKEVHFPNKEPVGARLALAARANVYGDKIQASGPIYHMMTVTGSEIRLSFRHVGGGLVAKGGALKGFTMAGADKAFTNATARIDGAQVIVSSPHVPQPVAVRYGWATAPELTLYNQEGLPASPFRTDSP